MITHHTSFWKKNLKIGIFIWIWIFVGCYSWAVGLTSKSMGQAGFSPSAGFKGLTYIN
jgi:hypothetical protein